MLAALDIGGDLQSLVVYVAAASIPLGIGYLVRQSAKGAQHNRVVGEFVNGRPAVKNGDGEIVQPGIPPARVQMESLAQGQVLVGASVADLQTDVKGIKAHLDDQDAVIDRVEHEVIENDGSSVKDSAKRTEIAVKKVSTQVATVQGKLTKVARRLDEHIEQVADNETHERSTKKVPSAK
jgi:hypothetical protein